MTPVTVELPDAVHRVLCDLAERNGVSVEEFLAGEAASALERAPAAVREAEAERGRAMMAEILALVPDAGPDPRDERPAARPEPADADDTARRRDPAPAGAAAVH